MKTGRMEAFSDGVLAIIITIMVLEIKAPHDHDFASLKPLIPVFLSYVLSFIYLGIYWNNHHHMLHATDTISGGALWANLHLLFWLSLIPFVTGWMGENHFASSTMVLYGIVLLMSAIAYWILQRVIIRKNGKDSTIARGIGKNTKGNISPLLYIIAIVSAFFNVWIAGAIYVLVALIWLIPDKHIERMYDEEEQSGVGKR